MVAKPSTCHRTVAVHALTRVLAGGEALDEALAGGALDTLPARDQALVKELCFGTLRWYWRLHTLLGWLMNKPLRAKDRDVEAALLIGLYQLLYMRTPAHAAIHATVDLAATLNKPWARGLINGVLRNAQRRRDELLGRADRDPVASTAHPQWLLDRLRQAWPDHWRDITAANNERPPMTLRANLRQGSREQWAAALAEAGIGCHATPYGDTGLTLDAPQPTSSLPGFDQGRGSVQDAAAQLCAPLLQLDAGQRVLDACAAPGGKTGHILEQQPALAELVAVDRVSARLQPLRDNLQRLDLTATVVDGDALQPEDWWDGTPFDRILLDAPCSGSGVIRRHPDIKLLRRASDAQSLADRQSKLLQALWPLLKQNGILLYVTCSILPQENDQVLAGFLSDTTDAGALPIDAPWGLQRRVGRQLLPGEQDMDGFYFARLVKH